MDPIFRILPVLENKKLGPYHKIVMADEQTYKFAECGSFIMIGLQGFDPYLSRPFSFLGREKDTFSILLQVKGRGTELLSEVKKGDKLKVLGPLGKTFCPPEKGILIAGGIGIAPVYYQSGWMKGGILFYGAKRRKDLILTREFEEKGFEVKTITEEDGGLVTDLVEKYKHEFDEEQIFVCGPTEMIKSVKKTLNKKQINKAYAYMEERMGCGLGGCKSCVVKTIEGYKLVCTEGPIFPLKEVNFD